MSLIYSIITIPILNRLDKKFKAQDLISKALEITFSLIIIESMKFFVLERKAERWKNYVFLSLNFHQLFLHNVCSNFTTQSLDTSTHQTQHMLNFYSHSHSQLL